MRFKGLIDALMAMRAWKLMVGVVLLSEVFTAVLSSLISLLWWGRLKTDIFVVGVIDSFIVSFIVGGIIVYIFSILREREQSLEASEEDYHTLLETANDLIQIVETDGTLKFANRAWRETLGYGKEDFGRLKVFDLIHPDFMQHCDNTFRTVQEKGSAGPFETTFLAKNGTVVLLEGSCNCVFQDGQPSHIVTIFRDITERKRMEEQLSESEADWEDTFNTITDMITIHDREMNIVRANESAKLLLGLPDLLVNDKIKCYEKYHGSDCPPDDCPSCKCIKTKEPVSIEVFEPKLDKFLEIRAIPRFDREHNITGSIHIVRDITASKRLEEQLHLAQKMEAIGTLTGGVAHEFNNILTSILGFSEILQDELKDGSNERKYANMIATSAKRAAKLTNGLLAYSRKQKAVLEIMDINEVLNEVNDFLLPIKGERISITIKPSGKPLVVEADKAQLEQVFMNLATNAMDAMSDGGTLTFESGRIEVNGDSSAEHGLASPGEYAQIEVRDTGEGMDQETLQRVFEPFFTTKDVGKGTGLGLSVVYGIIRKHKGNITVDSLPGEGTAFRVFLPLSHDSALRGGKEARAEAPGGTETILLAEDDAHAREFLGTALRNAGYSVLSAENGLEAVEQFRGNRESIRLVILDVGMPHMTGTEAGGIIQEESPSARIIFLSGYNDDNSDISRIIEQGGRLIRKPVSTGDLLHRVRDVIEGRE